MATPILPVAPPLVPPITAVTRIEPTPITPFEGFDITQLLGTGSFSEVYQATKDGVKYAVKRTHQHRIDRDGLDGALMEETAILKSLQHPNIIQVIHAGFDNTNRSWIVLPYMPQTLRQLIIELNGRQMMPGFRLRSNLAPRLSVRSAITQMLEAVAYLRNQNVIHRDIKSDNVLYDGEGTLKLADFGSSIMSACIPGLWLDNTLTTLWFTAPEMVYGSTRYTSGVDDWALGCMLYNIVVGKYLYSGATSAALLADIVAASGVASFNVFSSLPNWSTLAPVLDSNIEKREPFKVVRKKEIANMLIGLTEIDPARRARASDFLPKTDDSKESCYSHLLTRAFPIVYNTSALQEHYGPDVERQLTYASYHILNWTSMYSIVYDTYFYAIDVMYTYLGILQNTSVYPDMNLLAAASLWLASLHTSSNIYYKDPTLSKIGLDMVKVRIMARNIAEQLQFDLARITCYDIYRQCAADYKLDNIRAAMPYLMVATMSRLQGRCTAQEIAQMVTWLMLEMVGRGDELIIRLEIEQVTRLLDMRAELKDQLRRAHPALLYRSTIGEIIIGVNGFDPHII